MFRLTKSKPLQSLSHQLVQKCSVGGTPKGKAKLKAGVQLKRSKFSTKKGASPKSAKPFTPDEKQRQYDECLNAPTPVRYLTRKERKREIEREKLGLMSKDRKREIEILKKEGKESMGITDEPMITGTPGLDLISLGLREIEREKLGLKSKDRKREIEILKKGVKESMGITDEPMIMGTPGLDLISLGLVDVEKIPKYELTAEDGKRLAKEYSRLLMRRHRARQAAETTLLKCKKEAIEALPEDLKAAALVPDLTPLPEKVSEAARRSSVSEKIR